MQPILEQATSVLGEGSKAVINSEDQYEVRLVCVAPLVGSYAISGLRQSPCIRPVPQLALQGEEWECRLVCAQAECPLGPLWPHLERTGRQDRHPRRTALRPNYRSSEAFPAFPRVTLTVLQAWSDNSNPSHAIDQVCTPVIMGVPLLIWVSQILEAFHHPYYASGRSNIQNAMFQEMEGWLRGLGEDEARETINALTKVRWYLNDYRLLVLIARQESVRNGKNKRLGSENENLDEPGYGGCGHGAQPQRRPQGQTQSYDSGDQQQYGGVYGPLVGSS